MKTALTSEEESSLVRYLLYMAERGFHLTRTMTKAFAWAIAKRSGNDCRFSKNYGPSEHWWQLFRNRHPEFCLRKSDSLERNTREKVVAAKGVKNVYSQTLGTSDHITLLCCVSAAEFPLPPMIIYAKSFPGGQCRFQGPDDALYAKSDSRWIDSELFLTWFKKIF